jgi:hypothetical protein
MPFSHGAMFGSGGYVASLMVPVGFWKTSTAQSALQSNLGKEMIKPRFLHEMPNFHEMKFMHEIMVF